MEFASAISGGAPMIKALSLTLAAGLAAANVSSADAASVNRAWVSGHGTDATGCGAPASPCRSFQYVIDNVIAPNGEIDVLDPAGYGAVTIPFAVSIVNDGVGVAGIQAAAGDQAVTIQADASAAVHLRGLTIEGGGVGRIGIQLNSAGSLD